MTTKTVSPIFTFIVFANCCILLKLQIILTRRVWSTVIQRWFRLWLGAKTSDKLLTQLMIAYYIGINVCHPTSISLKYNSNWWRCHQFLKSNYGLFFVLSTSQDFSVLSIDHGSHMLLWCAHAYGSTCEPEYCNCPHGMVYMLVFIEILSHTIIMSYLRACVIISSIDWIR